MSKHLLLVALVLLTLAVLAFAQEKVAINPPPAVDPLPELKKDSTEEGAEDSVGKEFDEKQCVKYRDLKCVYVNKCTKAEEYCKQQVIEKHECKKWGTEVIYETKRVCVELEPFDRFDVNKCFKCAKMGEEKVAVKKDKCEEWGPIYKCVHWGSRCTEHKLLKRCYVQVNEYELEGPKECPANQQLFFTLVGSTIFRTCAAKITTTQLTCGAYLDPHMVNNKGQNYEFQKAGDFVMIKSSEGVFETHVRFKLFGSYSGPVAVAIRPNGRDIIEYTNGGAFLLNGHKLEPQVNVKAILPEGGYIIVKSQDAERKIIDFAGPNGIILTYDDHGYSGNIGITYPNNVQVTGLCAGAVSESAAGLFSYKYRSEMVSSAIPPVTFKSEEERQNAITLCKNRGLDTGDKLEMCLTDYARTPEGFRRDALDSEAAFAKENPAKAANDVKAAEPPKTVW